MGEFEKVTFSYSNTKSPIHKKQICFNLYCSETSQHGFGVNGSTDVEVTEKRQFLFLKIKFQIKSMKNRDVFFCTRDIKKNASSFAAELFSCFHVFTSEGDGREKSAKVA